jgi:uncharacterized protein with HEPN domain
MRPDSGALARLWDIAAAADAIIRFTENLSSESYAASELTTAAVERKFEIIGEALSQIAKMAPKMAERITDFRQIIAFRNLLIHGYAVVQHDRVFRIAQVSIPSLREEVAKLLQELSGP